MPSNQSHSHRFPYFPSFPFVLALCVALAGCDKPPESAPAAPPTATPTAAPHDHDHADEHGDDESEDHDHAHRHVAPHGGALVPLGDEFAHVEVVLDAAKGEVTLYVLDGEAERPVRIAEQRLVARVMWLGGSPVAQPIEVALHAVENPLTGETIGETSEFRGTAAALAGADRFVAVLSSIKALGQTFTDVELRYPEGGEEAPTK